MKIGVPKERKHSEKRVAATPALVKALTNRNHQVFVEVGAGEGSGFSNEEYTYAGAILLEWAEDIWNEAEMIIKVKEPIGPEFDWMRPNQILFTYLHMAADGALTEKLLAKDIVGIGYETVQLEDGTLPLLAPMSEVAGALSVQMGVYCLEAKKWGMGILLSGVSGVKPAKVTIIGGGVSGLAAATLAAGLGASVYILDINPCRLRYVREVTEGRIVTVNSTRRTSERSV